MLTKIPVYRQTSMQIINTKFNENNSAVLGLLLADRDGRANVRIMQLSVLTARKKKVADERFSVIFRFRRSHVRSQARRPDILMRF